MSKENTHTHTGGKSFRTTAVWLESTNWHSETVNNFCINYINKFVATTHKILIKKTFPPNSRLHLRVYVCFSLFLS